MSIQVALFDFDGTLVDTNDAVISILHETAIHYRGYGFTDEELEAIIGKPLIEQMSLLSEENAEELMAYYRAAYRLVRDEKTKAYPGVKEMLISLKAAGIKIGIVSNKGRNGIDHGLALLGLSALIDVSVSKDDVTLSKPHPEGIYKALALVNHSMEKPWEVVFVGDSGHDIETGKRAGVQTILVDWTLLDKDNLLRLEPDFLAQSPEAICRHILEGGRQY